MPQDVTQSLKGLRRVPLLASQLRCLFPKHAATQAPPGVASRQAARPTGHAWQRAQKASLTALMEALTAAVSSSRLLLLLRVRPTPPAPAEADGHLTAEPRSTAGRGGGQSTLPSANRPPSVRATRPSRVARSTPQTQRRQAQKRDPVTPRSTRRPPDPEE
ncbi:hypothetical protein NDU88_002047 [Pleurodeles waltl]|uniref:Uncharacterized protein n=1 Tax=Pleurodeles waltl TaxID=8319 RepID=A0AAV7Q7L8_PLEWA|nr:hypothetical protein NDU88_002047 [Pleurodeles waltl]